VQGDRHNELAGMAESITAFCQRVRTGLAHMTFEQQRTLVELLIDRVLVANGDVEIRYAIPTHPRGEMTRFCQLRKDYFDNVIQILDLTNLDRGPVLLVVARNRRTPIDGDLLRHAMTTDRLGEKPLGRVLVPLLREEEIDGLALLLHRAIQRAPLPLSLARRLIHPPTDPDRPLVAVKRLLQLRTVLDDPPVDRGVIDLHPAFFHECFDMPRAQRVGDIPTDSPENDGWGEMRTFAADRHRRSPSCVILGYRGRSYPKSTQMKICDRTLMPPGAPQPMKKTRPYSMPRQRVTMPAKGLVV